MLITKPLDLKLLSSFSALSSNIRFITIRLCLDCVKQMNRIKHVFFPDVNIFVVVLLTFRSAGVYQIFKHICAEVLTILTAVNTD